MAISVALESSMPSVLELQPSMWLPALEAARGGADDLIVESALLQLGIDFESDPVAVEAALQHLATGQRVLASQCCRQNLASEAAIRREELAAQPPTSLLDLPWQLADSPEKSHAAQAWALRLLSGRERTERLLLALEALTGSLDDETVAMATADDGILLELAVRGGLIVARSRIVAALPAHLRLPRWWWTADVSAVLSDGGGDETAATASGDEEVASITAWVRAASQPSGDVWATRLTEVEARALLSTSVGQELADLLEESLQWPDLPKELWTAGATESAKSPAMTVARSGFRQQWRQRNAERLAAATAPVVSAGAGELARFCVGQVGAVAGVGLVAIGFAEDSESTKPMPSWLVLPEIGVGQMRLADAELPTQNGAVLIQWSDDFLPLSVLTDAGWQDSWVSFDADPEPDEPLYLWSLALFEGDAPGAEAAMAAAETAGVASAALLKAMRSARAGMFDRPEVGP